MQIKHTATQNNYYDVEIESINGIKVVINIAVRKNYFHRPKREKESNYDVNCLISYYKTDTVWSPSIYGRELRANTQQEVLHEVNRYIVSIINIFKDSISKASLVSLYEKMYLDIKD